MTTMQDLSRQNHALTVQHLHMVVNHLRQAPPPIEPGHDFLLYGLSTEVLRYFFGNTWVNEVIFANHVDVSRHLMPGRRAFRTESASRSDQLRHMQRVASLAEIIFNLQGTEGLRDRIRQMHDRDFAGALGEMDCATLIAAPGFRLRFVPPSGVRGLDYDAEITGTSGRILSCEFKTKRADTTLGTRTIWRTLDDARKQLPRGQPGIVFVRTPEPWSRSDRLQEVFGAAAERLFRQSQRVVASVNVWERWQECEEGPSLYVRGFKVMANRRSDLYDNDVAQLAPSMGRPQNPSWIPFRDIVSPK